MVADTARIDETLTVDSPIGGFVGVTSNDQLDCLSYEEPAELVIADIGGDTRSIVTHGAGVHRQHVCAIGQAGSTRSRCLSEPLKVAGCSKRAFGPCK